MTSGPTSQSQSHSRSQSPRTERLPRDGVRSRDGEAPGRGPLSPERLSELAHRLDPPRPADGVGGELTCTDEGERLEWLEPTEQLAPVESPSRRCLFQLVVSLDGFPIGRHVFSHGLVRIGRDEDCDLTLDDALCSRAHALIERARDGGFVVHDQQSSNGTKVNGVRVDKPRRLADGDVVLIGRTTLVFKTSLVGSTDDGEGADDPTPTAPRARAHPRPIPVLPNRPRPSERGKRPVPPTEKHPQPDGATAPPGVGPAPAPSQQGAPPPAPAPAPAPAGPPASMLAAQAMLAANQAAQQALLAAQAGAPPASGKHRVIPPQTAGGTSGRFARAEAEAAKAAAEAARAEAARAAAAKAAGKSGRFTTPLAGPDRGPPAPPEAQAGAAPAPAPAPATGRHPRPVPGSAADPAASTLPPGALDGDDVFGQTLVLQPRRVENDLRETSLPERAFLRETTAERWSGAEAGQAEAIHVVDRDVVLIGGGEDADVKIGNVLTPRVVAVLVRGHGGFSMNQVAGWPWQARVNGRVVSDREPLEEGDVITVGGRAFTFHRGQVRKL